MFLVSLGLVAHLLPLLYTSGAAIAGDRGGTCPLIFRQGDDMLYVRQLTSQCMLFSSLTSFHSIQLQK